ncbi:MAG: lactate utilization protein [Christensenellaceae bacterium]|jgi:L-lactate utilization protein LutB|nr:lactate utilization protein [Christensenellaceae bacterium]
MSVEPIYNRLLAEKTIENMAARNLQGFYCQTRGEALQKALELAPEGESVSFGGSEAVRELGLRAALRGRRLLDPDEGVGGAEKEKIARQAMAADCYFMGANAIALSGELVNIDGYGNRVSALIFGPSRVVVIAGVNKIEQSLESAVFRAKTVAAQKTLLLFKKDYASFDELRLAADGARGQTVITERAALPGRIFVILVGEALGF